MDPFLSLKNQENLIKDVVLHKLEVHRDPRGLLMETLKETWSDVFVRPALQFGQSYFSITQPGFARDEDKWHNHPTKQTDRFVILKGNAVVALYDWRKESPTNGRLNLFAMGEKNGDDNQYLLLIPVNVLHGFCTVGDKPCYLISYPSQHYDPSEEGRIPFSEVNVKFQDSTLFSWEAVRQQFDKIN